MEIQNTEETTQETKKKRGRPAKSASRSDVFIPENTSFDARRINFDHIINAKENIDKEFAIISDNPMSNLINAQRRGWQLYEEKDLDNVIIPNQDRSDKRDNRWARVATGYTQEGISYSYLLFMDKEQYAKTILAHHDRKAKDQLSLARLANRKGDDNLGAQLEGNVKNISE